MKLPDFLTRDDVGNIPVTGHRIGLQDVVFYYYEGYSPELLVGQFPMLTLPLVHKAIAFYLENPDDVDAYVKAAEESADRLRASSSKGPGLRELRRRVQAMRRAQPS